MVPSVRVVLVSGFGVEVSPADLLAHGVDLVLAKPLKLQDLGQRDRARPFLPRRLARILHGVPAARRERWRHAALGIGEQGMAGLPPGVH